jgi:hypothetical protein
MRGGWGKDMLIKGVFADRLRLITAMSVSDIERAYAGDPSGVSSIDLLRSWGIWIDEFRTVKSEIKMLNNGITAAPKGLMRFTAPTYMKLFTSAEGVDSLAGENGAEKQFADRFSILESDGRSIADRAMFQQDKAGYITALATYVMDQCNAAVERFRAMGRDAASRVADAETEAFHRRHNIGNHFGTLDDNLDIIAEEIRRAISDHVLGKSRFSRGLLDKAVNSIAIGKRKSKEGETMAFLRQPVAFVKAWIREHMDHSQHVLVGYKATDILARLQQDYRPSTVHWVYTGDTRFQAKGVWVPLDGEPIPF